MLRTCLGLYILSDMIAFDVIDFYVILLFANSNLSAGLLQRAAKRNKKMGAEGNVSNGMQFKMIFQKEFFNRI